MTDWEEEEEGGRGEEEERRGEEGAEEGRIAYQVSKRENWAKFYGSRSLKEASFREPDYYTKKTFQTGQSFQGKGAGGGEGGWCPF